MPQEVDVRVLGGLPITVAYSTYKAEPDIGIFSPGIDEWWITAINNKKCKKEPEWLYNKIKSTPGEEERLLEKLN